MIAIEQARFELRQQLEASLKLQQLEAELARERAAAERRERWVHQRTRQVARLAGVAEPLMWALEGGAGPAEVKLILRRLRRAIEQAREPLE
jgi:hypothetical protein